MVATFCRFCVSLYFEETQDYICSFILVVSLCLFGVSKITTNYKLLDNLPRGAKVTEDFLYFEKNFSGFRPLEFAITVKPPFKADSYSVVKEIDKLENYLRSTGAINSSLSQAMLYKSMSMMANGNQKSFYSLPSDSMVLKNTEACFQKCEQLRQPFWLIKTTIKHGWPPL